MLRRLLFSVRSFRNQPSVIHQVARGTVVVFLLQMAGMLTGYVGQAVLARQLGAYEYGIYRYAYSWITVLGTLACLGFPTALQRFVPEHVTRGEREYLRGLLLGSRVLVLSAGLGTAVLATLVFGRAARGWLEPAQADALTCSAWLIPVVAVLTLETQLARAFHRMVAAFVPDQLGRPGAALVVGVLVGWIVRPGGKDVLAAIGAILLAICILQWVWVDRIASPLVRDVRRSWAWRRWFSVALPLLLMTIFGILLNQVGVLMVGSVLGPAEAGIFSVAVRVSSLVSFFLIAVNNVVAPRISELFHGGRKDELQRVLSRVVHWIFWPSLATGVGLALLGGPALSLFGRGFSGKASVTVLVVLVAGHLVNSAAGPVGLIMNVTGHQNMSAVVYGSAAGINVLLNVVLLPRYGVVGGALAMASTMVLWNVALVWIVGRRLDLHPSIFTAFRRG